jgi:ABC-type multidrug transport system, ATPase and permease components
MEVIFVVATDGLMRLSTYNDSILTDRYALEISRQVISHATSLDLETFENPKFQDRLTRARMQTDSQLAVLTTVAQLIQSVANLTAMTVAVALYKPWLVALQLFAILPVAFSEAHFASTLHELNRQRTPVKRTMEYLLNLGTVPNTVKEIKAYGLGRHLLEEYCRLGMHICRENADIARRQAAVGGTLTICGSAIYYLGYGLLVWEAIQNRISIGALVFLSGSIQRSKWQMQVVFTSISRALEQAMQLGDVFEFFAMTPRVTNVSSPRPVPHRFVQGFEFRSVCFRYQGATEYAIRNMSFTLKPGETIALVGLSGAGKSTITKLIARFYDPTEGTIFLDGINLKEYDLDSLHKAISIVFQDFVRYEFTAGLNIGVGDIPQRYNKARLDAAASAGMAASLIDRFPHGYDQVVGNRFEGGVELSGGEWQKLALSRACMRDAQLLILDEPSSALDVRSELALFKHFSTLTRDKTSLLISHRFSTARIADKIILIERGEIREQGCHKELIATGGEYAKLFNLQAEGYQ